MAVDDFAPQISKTNWVLGAYSFKIKDLRRQCFVNFKTLTATISSKKTGQGFFKFPKPIE